MQIICKTWRPCHCSHNLELSSECVPTLASPTITSRPNISTHEVFQPTQRLLLAFLIRLQLTTVRVYKLYLLIYLLSKLVVVYTLIVP